ncbi:hypothetical protein PF005_g22291 [Phytophthora fragariae]|uniref:Uncharacterized protein n=1 Tax=Phytophthora fragariae TaxID=53985 RepID=A0A6A3QTT4_9STRA|nr:hypothetical protein PF003_g26970 [Phytophthora fragariae]KAE8926699.1 hypothetical protein PF009_g23119 [Phytophthora fragariae]KAE8984109.1 hypothetical protein PF011_g20907 [Phytophthora fragariae]KAE9082453.1 hypothetical protein PF007_g22285 [Phytophthora fragariae]KAE9082963.1 hypothetical protein PF010_g21382 [Phytophthora fragariae]
MPWVAAWNTVLLGAEADHKGAKLHVRFPDDPIRIQRPPRVHPVPGYAASAVTAVTTHVLEAFMQKLQTEGLEAATAADKWDEFKQEIARRTRVCVRERKRVLRNSIKQKLARLIRQQHRLQAENDGAEATVDSITEDFECLALDDTEGPTRPASLRRAIADCKRNRTSIKQHKLYREATHWTGKTTKALFSRVSNKYSDNVIHRLDPVHGAPVLDVHDKADTLADA